MVKEHDLQHAHILLIRHVLCLLFPMS